MLSRILSLLLFITFIFEVSGASFPDTEYSFYRDSIEKLSNSWVIDGFEDGTFWAEKTITRAEFLKILMRVKWIDVTHTERTRCFPDIGIAFWYRPYICEAVKLWGVKGFEDGTFKPNNPVTSLEALAMGLRLYWLAPEDGNPWYTTYRDFAQTNNILSHARYSLSSPLSRWEASEFILRLEQFAHEKKPLNYKSVWCENPRTLEKNNTLTIVWKNRSYLLSSIWESTAAKMLIIAIHGRTNSNTQVQNYMWLEGSNTENLPRVIVYPAWLDAGGGTRSWSAEDNITFIDAIIDEVTHTYCIDRSNVFIVWHSLGAWFTSKMTCLRSDVFRGMAIVGWGWFQGQCRDTPTASLIYQNENDRLSPMETARKSEYVMRWLNTCGNTTEPVDVAGLTCFTWQSCSTGNPVTWCQWYPTYLDDPHSWPLQGGQSILGFFRNLQ